jgi:predicted Zn-dependent peptidase
MQQWFGPVPKQLLPAMSILRVILAGRYNSWIFGEARRRGLAYHVALGFDTYPHNSTLGVGAFVTPGNAAELFKLIADKLLDVRAAKFSSSEVNEAKQFFIGSILRAYKTPGQLADFYAEDFFVNDYVYEFHDYLEGIKKVTMTDIAAMCGLVFEQPCWGLSLVGDITPKLAQQLHQQIAKVWD